MELRRISCYLLATVAVSVSVFPDKVMAQISSDGTLSTTVSTDDAVNFLIEGGERSLDNLFHSFSEFSIPNLGEAYFNNATDITNIFSRVTGGNISEIQGLIRANGTANLFLINPAGIVFGENASLDVGGSFFATTAESVVFGDGIEFSAVEPQEAPLLTVNITPGLQMGANPGTIAVQGNGHNLALNPSTFSPIRENRPVGLQVNSGQTLGLIGGDILVEGGNLTANQGRIELGSVAQSGTVDLVSANDGFTLDYSEIENFGNLSFTQASSVEVSGEGSGNLHFQAGNISVLENSAIISNVLGTEDGGEVLIRASESIEITGTDTGEFPSAFFNQGELDTTGNVGNLSIEAGSFQLATNAFIANSVSGSGNGGDWQITANDIEVFDETNIDPGYITGLLSQVSLGGGGIGQGGDLTINAQNISFRDGVSIFTTTNDLGDAGNLTINATALEVVGTGFDGTLATLVSADTFSSGQGGNLAIETESLSVRDGAQLAAGSFGEGNSGNFTIRAKTIEVIGVSAGFLYPSGLFVDYSSSGNGGNLIIETESFSIQDGGNIFSGGLPGSQGDGGSIIIRASESIEIIGKNEAGNSFSLLGSLTQGGGNGGTITLETPYLRVTQGGIITAATFGTGDGGSIEIQADTVEISDAALDFSGTLNGIVSFVAPESLDFEGNFVPPATGNGGSITINANQLSLSNGGQIDASTFGEGTAGNINLNVSEINLTGISEVLEDGTQIPTRITSTSETDFAAGSVNITADNLTVNNGAEVSVSGNGLGNAGNLSINAAQISLDNQASLQGNVAIGKQGNINLTSQLLLLRNNSNITTNASNLANGGNITIDTVNLVALEDSDITANAVFGQGGNIIITAQGLFLSLDSDITASSEFGVDGVVEINTPDEENKLAIAELPANFTDASQQIVGNCSWTRDNTFYVVGRRGIATTPQEHIQDYTMWSDIRDLSEFESTTVIRESSPRQEKTIVEANAMIINGDGQVELVAVVPSNNQNLGQVASSCSGEEVIDNSLYK